MNVDALVARLLSSDVASIRFKIRVNALCEDSACQSILELRDEVKRSELVGSLLARQGNDGRIATRSPYDKWQGAHWVLATLADIGYPEGDMRLAPIRDQLQSWWLHEKYYKDFQASSRGAAYRSQGVPVMNGRHRRCASQQSNALWSILKLGLANEQTEEFVERLLYWQWPDGGWNCDKNPDAHHSSFMESILPLRALALYNQQTGDEAAGAAAWRAAEIFLKRGLYRRERERSVISPGFVQLHYPLYWHYDLLHGLKVLAEADLIHDPRCQDALTRLIEKQLPDGGWPAEKKYYRASGKLENGSDYVDWGGTSAKRMNPWVSADALFVLQRAGMLELMPRTSSLAG